MLHRGRALEGAQLHEPGDRLGGAALAVNVPVGAVQLGAAWNTWRQGALRDEHGQVWARWGW